MSDVTRTSGPSDGFDDADEGQQSARVIQGAKIAFSNDGKWVNAEDEVLPAELEVVAVKIGRVLQKWIAQLPVDGETRFLEPREHPDIEALNAACPQSEWSPDLNGKPRGPFQLQNVVYLVDMATMQKFTYPTGTVGGGICVHELKDAVQLMRQFRGPGVYPVVSLANTFMNTRFGGRQRPQFKILRWISFGPGGRCFRPRHRLHCSRLRSRITSGRPRPGGDVHVVEAPTLREEWTTIFRSEDCNVCDTRWPAAPVSGPQSSYHQTADNRAMPFCCEISKRGAQLLLKACWGMDRYATHPSTDVWCCAYAVDDGPIQLWIPGDPVPPEFIEAAQNPDWLVAAFNDQFERLIERHIMAPALWLAGDSDRTASLPAGFSAGPGIAGKPVRCRRCAEARAEQGSGRATGHAGDVAAAQAARRRGSRGVYWLDDAERRAQLYAYCQTGRRHRARAVSPHRLPAGGRTGALDARRPHQ